MKAVAAACGKLLYKLVVCAVTDLQEEWMGDDVASGPFPFDPEAGFETLANVTSPHPVKKTRLVTIAAEVKLALAALFGCLATAVAEGGKLPAQGVRAHLLGADRGSRAREVRFLVQVAEVAKVPDGELSRRVFGSVGSFGDKLRALVGQPDLVTPGAEPVAYVFVQFLKAVAFRAAAFICGMKTTLNLKFFLCLIKDFRSFPGVDLEEETVMFLRGQVARAAAPAPAPAAAPSAPSADAPDAPVVPAQAARADNVSGPDVPPPQ